MDVNIFGVRFLMCLALAFVATTAECQHTQSKDQATRNILYGLVTTETTRGDFALLSITNISGTQSLEAVLKVFLADQVSPIASHQIDRLAPGKTTIIRVPLRSILSYYELSYPREMSRPVIKVETSGDRSLAIYSGSSSPCSAPQTLREGIEYFLLMKSPKSFAARFIGVNRVFTRTFSTGVISRRFLSLNVSADFSADFLKGTSATIEPFDRSECSAFDAYEMPIVIAAQIKPQSTSLTELHSEKQALQASQRGEAYTFSPQGGLIAAPFSQDMVPLIQAPVGGQKEKEAYVVVRIPSVSPRSQPSGVAPPAAAQRPSTASNQPIQNAPLPIPPIQDSIRAPLPPAPSTNNAPSFILKPPSETTVRVESEVVLFLKAEDRDVADNMKLLFTLKEPRAEAVIVSNILPNIARFAFIPKSSGRFPFDVIVKDPRGAQSVASFAIVATDIPPPTNPLRILSPGQLTVSVPGSLSTAIRSEPPGASFALLSDGGLRGLNLSRDGLLSGVFAQHQQGRYSAQVAATLGAQTSSAFIAVNLVQNTTNRAPVIVALPTLLGRVVGQPVELVIAANDLDDDKVSLSLLNPPKGASLTKSGGAANEHRFTWTPSQVGNYNFTVFANDARGGTDTRAFTVEVVSQPPANRAPIVERVPDIEIPTTQPWRYQIIASDPDIEPLRYYVFENAYGLPRDFQYDKNSGLMAWTPALNQHGDYRINYRVTDRLGSSAQGSFKLTVKRYIPPEVRFASIKWQQLTAIAGKRFEQQWYVTRNGTPVEPNSIRFSILEKPSSSNVTNSGLATWTPSYTDIGQNFRFTAQVTDNFGAQGVVSQNIRVVDKNSPPRTPTGSTNGGLTKVSVGKELAYRIPFQDADGDPVRCHVALVVPGAPRVSETCDVRFTPTRNQLFKSYSVTVFAYDGTDSSRYQFDVVVVP